MKKALHFLDENLEKGLSVIFLAGMSALIIIQIFCRFVLNNSLSWTEEAARYLFVMLSFFASSYGVKMNKHICIDVIYMFLSKRGQKKYEMISSVFFIAFCVIVVYYGFQNVIYQKSIGQSAAATHLPMWFIYSGLPVGFGLCLFRLVQNFVLGIRELRAEKHTDKEELP